MKKISTILASLVLLAGISFANPVLQSKTDKKEETKKDDKKDVKKVPSKKKTDKKDTKTSTAK